MLDCATQKWQTKIGRIQNRCLRTCLKKQIRGNPVVKLHTDCTTPLPPLRRKEMLITHFYSRSKKLKPSVNPRTRNNFLPTFTLRRPRTEFYKKSPFYRGAREWNKLPPSLRCCDKKFTFKAQLKRLLGTYFKNPKKKKKKGSEITQT